MRHGDNRVSVVREAPTDGHELLNELVPESINLENSGAGHIKYIVLRKTRVSFGVFSGNHIEVVDFERYRLVVGTAPQDEYMRARGAEFHPACPGDGLGDRKVWPDGDKFSGIGHFPGDVNAVRRK